MHDDTVRMLETGGGAVTRLDNWDEVIRLAGKARRSGQVVTNFFPDKKRMSRWCEANTFFFSEQERTTFLVRRQGAFSTLYFLAESPESLFPDICDYIARKGGSRTIVDIVGFDETRFRLEETFKKAGFAVLTVLQRMSRKTPVGEKYQVRDVATAQVQDVTVVHDLLHRHFVAEEEQVPDIGEIRDWIDAGHVFVSKDGPGGNTNGFIIFDLFPSALYLRYWFVSPRMRGKGVGGQLMRAMFAAGANTKRQYFWVKSDNENAIVRYRRYGFEFEALKDTVLAYGPRNR